MRGLLHKQRQLAYEIMSKSVDAEVLKRIHGEITAKRIQMSEEEATALYPRIKDFKQTHGREPSLVAPNGTTDGGGIGMAP